MYLNSDQNHRIKLIDCKHQMIKEIHHVKCAVSGIDQNERYDNVHEHK